MNNKLKAVIRKMLNVIGFDIIRIPKKTFRNYNCTHHVDAYLDQKRLLKHKEVNTIFDIGAHTGQTINNYKKLFSTASIYSFEPFQESFDILCEKYNNDNTVKLFKLALANQNGRSKFYFNKASFTNSLLSVSSEADKYVDNKLIETVGFVDVEVATIDSFCKNNGINNIHILKIDVQGGELRVLQGARNLINTKSVDLIYIEVQFAPIYQGQAYFYNICEYLNKHGYILYGIYNLNYGLNEILAWGDAIFISQDLENTQNTHLRK